MATNTTTPGAVASAVATPLGNEAMATGKDISSTRYRNSNNPPAEKCHFLVHGLTKVYRDDTTNESVAASSCEEVSSEGSDDEPDTLPEVTFIPTQCLFCNILSPTFDANLSHMSKKHGLFLPARIDDGTKVLAVELATLVQYLHLVIFGYHECLLCHTQRQNPHAVQQHMMGRGHCRTNLDEVEGEVNEYREFYEDVADQRTSSDDGGDPTEEEGSTAAGKTPMSAPLRTEDNTLRLSSGKILTHRSTPPTPKTNRRPLAKPKAHSRHDAGLPSLEDLIPTTNPGPTKNATDNDDTPDGPKPPSSSSTTQTEAPHHHALTRTERRAQSHHSRSVLTTAVARMSTRDRGALAHLAPAERRAVVVAQFRQQDRAAQAERRYRGKLERLPNEPSGGMALWLRVAKYG